MEINKLDINSKEFKKKFNVFKSAKYNKRENRKRLVVITEGDFFYFCIFTRYAETRKTRFDFYEVDPTFKSPRLFYSDKLSDSDFTVEFDRIKKGNVVSCFFTNYEDLSSTILSDILFAKKDYLETIIKVFL